MNSADKGSDGRNGLDVRVLHVNVERTRARILERADGLVGRLHAVDRNALQLPCILFKEAVTKEAKRVLICVELLDNQIVVFAGLDESAVLAKTVADRLVLSFVSLFERDQNALLRSPGDIINSFSESRVPLVGGGP